MSLRTFRVLLRVLPKVLGWGTSFCAILNEPRSSFTLWMPQVRKGGILWRTFMPSTESLQPTILRSPGVPKLLPPIKWTLSLIRKRIRWLRSGRCLNPEGSLSIPSLRSAARGSRSFCTTSTKCFRGSVRRLRCLSRSIFRSSPPLELPTSLIRSATIRRQGNMWWKAPEWKKCWVIPIWTARRDSPSSRIS